MKKIILLGIVAMVFCSCKKKAEEEAIIHPVIPVTLTKVDTSGISNYVDLNATATYLVKNIIKSNATGYLNTVAIQNNDFVTKGKELFTLKTREAKVLGTTISKIDPSLNFGNPISIKAATDGFISNVNARQGDYVQDGDALATISDVHSFAIVLGLPYPLKSYVNVGNSLQVYLPDGRVISARVKKFMANVDAVSQTQNVVLECNEKNIPENLIVKVRVIKSTSTKTVSLPKAAVLSDESETNFWIMKMINKDTAIKIPIKKGIENGDKVEILSPKLTIQDQILLTGNYGVNDTIKVRVIP